MSAAAAALVSRFSGRSGIGFAIIAVHVVLIYGLCMWSPIRQVFNQAPLEASIIDMPNVTEAALPPPPPQIAPVQLPTMDPPVITISDPPPANAITIAKVEEAPPQQTQGAPRVITDVAYLEPPAPKYPPESRRTGEQGLVILKVLINELGRAARIEIERSSGFARLDAAARAAVERAVFRPYVENGVPRMALATIPVDFTWKSRAAARSGRS
jgi:protein TonB